MQAAKITPTATEWSLLLLHDLFAARALQCVMQQNGPFVHCLPGVTGVHSMFFVPGDLDNQTCQSEGPNMSYV